MLKQEPPLDTTRARKVSVDRAALADQWGGELLLLDPPESFDKCILGIGERCGSPPVVIYDREMVIDSLMMGGMGRDEAEEYFAFNTAGAYLGPSTPMFLTRLMAP